MEQLPPGCLLKYNHALPQTNGAVFLAFVVSLSRCFVHERGVCFDFKAQRKQTTLNWQKCKGQDDFIVFSSFFCHPLKVWEQQMCCSYCRLGEIRFISSKASPFLFHTLSFLGRSQSITAHRSFETHTRVYELRHSIFRRVQFTIYCVSALSF